MKYQGEHGTPPGELSPLWVRVAVWMVLAITALAAVWVIDRRAMIVMRRAATERVESASQDAAVDPRLP